MKRRTLVVAWFALLLLWNFFGRSNSDYSLIERVTEAFEYLLAPVEILASVIVLVVIWKSPWNKRPPTQNV